MPSVLGGVLGGWAFSHGRAAPVLSICMDNLNKSSNDEDGRTGPPRTVLLGSKRSTTVFSRIQCILENVLSRMQCILENTVVPCKNTGLRCLSETAHTSRAITGPSQGPRHGPAVGS